MDTDIQHRRNITLIVQASLNWIDDAMQPEEHALRRWLCIQTYFLTEWVMALDCEDLLN